jgi:hypothetical protein
MVQFAIEVGSIRDRSLVRFVIEDGFDFDRSWFDL